MKILCCRGCLALIWSILSCAALAQDRPHGNENEDEALSTLYKVTLLRAAPEKFTTLADMLNGKVKRNAHFHILRHSQGAQWDFMILEPAGSYQQWFNEKQNKKLMLNAMWREHLDRLVSFRQEWFVYGPEHAPMDEMFATSKLYHVEMFKARAGHKVKLLRQRQMENEYLAQTHQPVNFVFSGDMGADWDVMTIGFHADLKAYAEGSPSSLQQKNEAARRAGFDSVDSIAGYLREQLISHQDTLAVPLTSH